MSAQSSSRCDVILTRIGGLSVGVDLSAIGSVLDYEQAAGFELIDLAALLGQGVGEHKHVGLLDATTGPPLGLCLGDVIGVETVRSSGLLLLPEWVHSIGSAYLLGACFEARQGELSWLIDLTQVLRAHYNTN